VHKKWYHNNKERNSMPIRLIFRPTKLQHDSANGKTYFIAFNCLASGWVLVGGSISAHVACFCYSTVHCWCGIQIMPINQVAEFLASLHGWYLTISPIALLQGLWDTTLLDAITWGGVVPQDMCLHETNTAMQSSHTTPPPLQQKRKLLPEVD